MSRICSRRWFTAALFICVALLPRPAFAHGGGVPRLTSQEIGPYRLYAWTEPEPMRVGEAHVTIAVTQPAQEGAPSGQVETPVTDARVLVTFTPAGGQPIEVAATTTSSLGDVYYAADTILPSAGDWRISIDVSGREGGGQGDFAVTVEAARRFNWTLASIGGILFIGMLALIALRAGRREKQPARPSRAARRHRGAIDPVAGGQAGERASGSQEAI